MQSRTVPEDQARGAETVSDGVMALPRPHRFDVYIAAGGLLGGLLLVGIGLGTRPSSDPMTPFDGPWPVLVPLTVPAGWEAGAAQPSASGGAGTGVGSPARRTRVVQTY